MHAASCVFPVCHRRSHSLSELESLLGLTVNICMIPTYTNTEMPICEVPTMQILYMIKHNDTHFLLLASDIII